MNIIRYWKGNNGTAKEGMYGTFEDGAPLPPNTTETNITDYQAYVSSLPPRVPGELESEIASLTAPDLTNVAKVKAILEKLRVGARML